MVIHAQRTTFRSSAQFPDFKVTNILNDGQILRYNDALRSFINVDASTIDGGGTSGIVTDGANVGTGSQIFKSLNINNLEFRTLLGGQGISLVEGTNEVEISNDIVSAGIISVNNSFNIEIDNDNTTASSAVFSLSTFSSPASVSLTPTTYTRSDIAVVLPNQFTTSGGDFVAAGLAAGMSLKVTGTTEQDGVWEIDTVTSNTITITLGAFPNLNDAGDQPTTTFEGMFFKFPTTNTLQMVGRDVAADGFLAEQSLVITGSTFNDDTYLITTAVGDTITVSGSGATATSSRTGDVVTGTTITAAGSGYIVLPAVTFAAPTSGITAIGTSTLGAITAIVVDRGSGYVIADILTLVGGTNTEAASFDVNDLSTVTGQTEAVFDNSPITEGTFVAGASYDPTDTITLSDGTVITVNGVIPINAQDETSYDDLPVTEGIFVGGIGHAALDVITLSDGTTITVDDVLVGVVTEFTVDSSSATATTSSGKVLNQTSTTGAGINFSLVLGIDNQEISTFTITSDSTSSIVGDAQTLTQSSTSGGGAGFTLTLDTDNQGVFDVTSATDGDYTVLPTDPISTTTGGTGIGVTLDAGWGVVSIVIIDGGSGYTSDPAITISTWTVGNDVGNITISVPAVTVATGWQVDETGAMSANDTTITGDASVSGTLTVGGIDINTIISAALPVFDTDGILVRTAADVFTARQIDVAAGLSITNADGIAGNPTIDVDDFDITLTGDTTGTNTVTDLGNVSIATTLAASGVTPGTYDSVTVDAKGRVTAGTGVTNPAQRYFMAQI